MENTTEKKVSIIVPVYKVEKYLERCVESLLRQTLKEIEIILVDDGSPDLCPELCDAYASRYENVRVIHKKNAGLGMARNTGLEVAVGEYVAFVDSDDYVEKEMYEELYSVAKEENADVVISGGFISEGAYRVTTINKEVEEEVICEGPEVKLLPLKMTGALPEHPIDYEYAMSVCKGIYNRELIVEHHVCFLSEREFISEDLLFHFDIFQHVNKAIVIPKYFYHYCLNKESLTKTYQSKRFQRNVQFYEYVLELLGKRGFSSVYNLYVERLLLASARVAITQVIGHYQRVNRKLFKELADVCNNEVLVDVLERYPIHRLPMKQRIFTYAMRNNAYIILYVLVRLNNITK